MSVSETSKQLRCTRGTLQRKLHLIQERTGKNPKYFRQFSGHLDRARNQVSDDRARHINYQTAINESADDEDQSI
jgi:hypothetical protein